MESQNKHSDQNTEQVILSAAEAEFLEKGFGNAKVLSIANRAGVSHSMLHYYFRSKEKLFQMVFQSKVNNMAKMFEDIVSNNLPFDQTLRQFIETQFDFLSQNPRLPQFMLTEIISNKENRDLVFEILADKAKRLATQMRSRLDQEIANKTIRNIKFEELLLNVVSVNVFTFLVMPVLSDLFSVNADQTGALLAARKESNVQFILNSLRP